MRRLLLALVALGAAAGFLYARRGSPPGLAAPAGPAEPSAAAGSPAPNRLLDELDPQPKERVLQLGLGDDALTFALAERLTSGKLEVFDADQTAADALADRARDRGLKNVSAWHGDPHTLLFEDNRFDRGLLLLADDENVRGELERVVKDGGRVVVAGPGGG